MAKVLVVGGIDRDEQNDSARVRFARALGRNIILRGHTLLGGCRTGLDSAVASAAAEAAPKRGADVRRVVRSWVTKTTTPIHGHGELVRSQLEDWVQIPRGLVFPEPIKEADAVIVLGGWDGTHFAASWARLAGKPLLPVASFGGAAADVYRDELSTFDRRYAATVPLEEYQRLNRLLSDESDAALEAHAVEVLILAERTILSSEVFVVMPFEDKGHLRDAYNTFRRVCTEKKFEAKRVDHHLDTRGGILPQIFAKIKHSAFVIAEVSGARPNVFYELGYARALGKAVIQTAYQGTELPFDVYDVQTLFWDSQDVLEKKLGDAIDQLTQSFGQYA